MLTRMMIMGTRRNMSAVVRVSWRLSRLEDQTFTAQCRPLPLCRCSIMLHCICRIVYAALRCASRLRHVFSALHRAVLRCTALCCAVPRCAVLFCFVPCGLPSELVAPHSLEGEA